MLLPIYSSPVFANDAEDEAMFTLVWIQFLPQLNAARSMEGLPALSGNFRLDMVRMLQECNNGVESSCAFLKGFVAAANRNRGTAQAQQFSNLPIQGTPYRSLGEGMPSIPSSSSDDYEAIGIHGERTTRAIRDAQIRRTAPNYNYGGDR
jgi:hypothetical protein